MTIQQFTQAFKLEFTSGPLYENTVCKTELFDRVNNAFIVDISTTFNTSVMNEFIKDSHIMRSIVIYSSEKVTEQCKRAQADHFIRAFQVDHFYPMNKDTDISALYK